MDFYCGDTFEVINPRHRNVIDVLGYLGGFYNAIHFIVLILITVYTGYYYNKSIVRSVKRASVLI